VTELSNTWPGRIAQGVAFAARLPLAHRAVRRGTMPLGPVSVGFYLGPRCNLRCSHCAFHGDADPVSFEDYRRVLDETWQLGAREITLTGGEPTLVKDFPSYLEYAVSRGWVVGFTTNGTTLKGRLLDRIVASGVHRISLSFDGLEARHDAVRGAGSFRRGMDGLEGLLLSVRRDRTQLRLNMVLMRHNLEDVLPLHEKAARRRVFFNVMPFTTDNLTHQDSELDPGLALDAPAKDHLAALLPAWLEQRRRLGWWLNTQAHLREILHFERTGRSRKRCLVGAYQFNIDHRLRVGFCTDAIGWIGDLTRQSAAEVWQGAEAAAARQRVGACHACVLNCFYTPTLVEAATDLLPTLLRSR
jgi:MoaA/NifB/PqqE/SkfB family radical SAM enzyme